MPRDRLSYDRLIALIEGRKTTVPELAKKLAISRQTIHNWRDRGVPPARYRKIAGFLGLTVEELLEDAPPESVAEPAAIYPLPVPPATSKTTRQILQLLEDVPDHVREEVLCTARAVVRRHMEQALKTLDDDPS